MRNEKKTKEQLIKELAEAQKRIAELEQQTAKPKQAGEESQEVFEGALESLRYLEVIMENIPLGITLADAPGVNIRYVSRYGLELTGRPREQLEGIPVEMHADRWDIYHSDGVTIAKNEELPLTRATQKGETVIGEEWVLGRPGGTRFPILCTAAPVRDKEGNITGGVIGWQDITELKKAAEELAATQIEVLNEKKRLEAVFNSLPIGMAILDEKGGSIKANSMYDELWGSPRPEVKGISDYEAFKAWWVDTGLRVRPDEWASAQAVQKEKTVIGQLMKIERFDGTHRFIINSGAPILDSNGKISGSAVAILDITQLKLAEEEMYTYRNHLEELVSWRTQELEEKNELLAKEISEREKVEKALSAAGEYNRSLIEASLDPLVTIDADGMITDVNKATEKVTGKERSVLIGTDFSEYFTEPSIARAGYKQVFSEGSVRDYPLEILHSDGSITPVLYNASIYRDKAGTVIGMFAAARDISKRKRAEESLRESEACYRLLADNASDIIFTLNADLRFTYISPSISRIRGYTVEEAMSQTLAEALTPASLEVVMRVYEEELEIEACGSKELWRYRTIELEEKCKNGSTIWTETIFTPLRDEKKKLTGFLGITRDINERKQAEEEKKKLENQLMQAQKIEALDRFAGGIAHDLNNILYPIIINTEQLLSEFSPDSARYEILNQTLKASYRQRDLIKMILTFCRKSEKKFSPIKLIPLLEETMDFLRSTLPSTIDILYHIDAQTDTIMGDSTQIQQVIMNLIQNAADAIESRRGIIEVILSNTHLEPICAPQEIHEGDYLRLTVRDTGYGMKPEVMDRIFEPFFTTKGVGKGTGMGLSVVHGILKNHGGAIIVQSQEGKGSVLTVYLPECSEEFQDQTSYQENKLPVNGKRNILLIDDEEIIVSSLQRVLKLSGYRVVALKDGLEALKLFEKKPYEFDLVITDLTMPGITGLELSQKLMRIRSDIPVILCTGFNDAIDGDEVRSLGIKELILKPAGTNELKTAIGRVLENS